VPYCYFLEEKVILYIDKMIVDYFAFPLGFVPYIITLNYSIKQSGSLFPKVFPIKTLLI